VLEELEAERRRHRAGEQHRLVALAAPDLAPASTRRMIAALWAASPAGEPRRVDLVASRTPPASASGS